MKFEYIPELRPELIVGKPGTPEKALVSRTRKGIIRESYLNRGGTTIFRPLFLFFGIEVFY